MKLNCTRGSSHEYQDPATGKHYFSVSQVLKVLDSDAFKYVDPYVMAASQERGKDLHVLFALTIMAGAGVCEMPPRPKGIIGKYYEGIELFVAERKPKPKKVEESSINDQLGYAGTLDFDGWLDLSPAEWILDLKTGPARAVHAAQLQAYKHLQGFETAKRLGSLYITKQGKYRLVEHTQDIHDWMWFQAGLSVLHGRRLHGII